MVETVRLIQGDPRAGGTSATGRRADEPTESASRSAPGATDPLPAEAKPANTRRPHRGARAKPAPPPSPGPKRQDHAPRPAPVPKPLPARSESSTTEEGREREAASISASRPEKGQGNRQGPGEGPGRYEGIFGAGEGPRFKRRVLPVYPPTARRQGRQGVVVLRLAIDASGTLTHVEVVQSAGHALDEEAVRAVKASSYNPASRGGRFVPCLAVIRIRFSLTS
ncbi:energy transducer TonB [Fundidesulfovibrio butyratiphilus]